MPVPETAVANLAFSRFAIEGSSLAIAKASRVETAVCGVFALGSLTATSSKRECSHCEKVAKGRESMKDDRARFLEERRLNSLALGEDPAAHRAAIEAFCMADKYRYAYLWTWLGLPIIQLPADVLATQEVVWSCKPDVIIETGVARGGSVIFLASLLELIGAGEVIGIDIDIRSHNRRSIEEHPLSKRVKLVEGSSTAPDVVRAVESMIPKHAKVMVILDSDHSHAHVLAELKAYAPLVTPGQYVVVADTLLGALTPEQTPKDRSAVLLPGNEPLSALNQFLTENNRFEVDPVLNGKLVFSSSPGGYLRRR